FTGAGFGGGTTAAASERVSTAVFSIDVSAGACATGAGAGSSRAAARGAIAARTTQLPRLRVGDRLHTPSGSAAPQTPTPAPDPAGGSAPPKPPPPASAALVIMTTRVIRSAGLVARPARITPSQCVLQTIVSDVPKIARGEADDPLRTLDF